MRPLLRQWIAGAKSFFGTAWFYLSAVWRRVVDLDVLFLASGLAFNGILTLVPLMLLLASALGIFLNSSALGVQQLNDVLNAIFPPQPFATSIKTSILDMLSNIVKHRTSLGIFGFLVLGWTALALFDAIRSVLHRVYYLKRTRGLLASLVNDVGFLLLAFVFFVVTNVAIWVSSLLERLAAELPALRSIQLEGVNEALPFVIIVLISTVMFYILYRHTTDSSPPRAAALISTVTTTILWVVSGKLFAVYLGGSSIDKIYGPYTFLLVLLIWIYYSSLIFVLGGIVGQIYWERTRAGERREG